MTTLALLCCILVTSVALVVGKTAKLEKDPWKSALEGFEDEETLFFDKFIDSQGYAKLGSEEERPTMPFPIPKHAVLAIFTWKLVEGKKLDTESKASYFETYTSFEAFGVKDTRKSNHVFTVIDDPPKKEHDPVAVAAVKRFLELNKAKITGDLSRKRIHYKLARIGMKDDWNSREEYVVVQFFVPPYNYVQIA